MRRKGVGGCRIVLTALIVVIAQVTGLPATQADDLIATEPAKEFGTGIIYTTKLFPDQFGNATMLLTAGSRGVYLWDTQTGELVQSFTVASPQEGIRSMTFDYTGTHLVTGGVDGVVRVWDISTGTEIRHMQVFEPEEGWDSTIWYLGPLFSEGRQVVAGAGRRLSDGTGGELSVWGIYSGERMGRIGPDREASKISSAAASQGRVVTSSNREAEVRLWDVSTGELIREFSHWDASWGVAISRNGTMVSANAGDGIVVWEADSGTLLHEFSWPLRGDALRCTFSPDGKFLAGNDNFDGPNVLVWNLETGELVQTLGPHGRGVSRVEFSSDGQRVFTDGSWDTIRDWDLQTGELLSSFEYPSGGTAVGFSPDGAQLVAGGSLWDGRTGEFGKKLGRQVNGVAFSPDGKRVATANIGDGRGFRILDTSSGETLLIVEGEDWVTAMCFSPSGDALLIGNANNEIQFWHSATGELIRTFEGHQGDVETLDFNPDGTLLLSGGGGIPPEAHLWDVEAGMILRTLTGIVGRTVQDATFSPDGEMIVTATLQSLDGTSGAIQLWNATTGSLIRSFQGITGNIRSVAFSPDGTKIVAANGSDARLWDATNGQQLRIFDTGEDCYSVAFSPNGQHLLTGGYGTAALWDIRDLLAAPRVVQSAEALEVRWDLGILQFAPTTTGPWTDLPDASPMPLSPIGEQGFFRVKVE